MMQIMYFIPLAAWLAFVYIQYQSGDRPTTYLWFAMMAGIGTFECTKGLFAMVDGMPAATMAFAAGVFAAGCVMIARLRGGLERKGVVLPERPIAAEGH